MEKNETYLGFTVGEKVRIKASLASLYHVWSGDMDIVSSLDKADNRFIFVRHPELGTGAFYPNEVERVSEADVLTKDHDRWFEAHFGEIPDQEKLRDLKEKVHRLALELDVSSKELGRLEELSKKLYASRLSFNASKNGYKF